MPKVLFINDNAVLIRCEYVPQVQSNDEQEQLKQAAIHDVTICRKICGYWKDAALKNDETRNKSNGQKDFKLICLHPTSPYLPELMKRLKETGNV